jgi:hypothetical protein
MIEWGIEGSNFRWHQFQIGKNSGNGLGKVELISGEQGILDLRKRVHRKRVQHNRWHQHGEPWQWLGQQRKRLEQQQQLGRLVGKQRSSKEVVVEQRVDEPSQVVG